MQNKELLKNFREQIDTLDREVLYLLFRRFTIVNEIWKIKKQEWISPLQKDRWKEVLENKIEVWTEFWLKKEFIDTGIIKIYFKHFPLDLAALNAAKILQCIDKKSRIALLDHLYETQKIWTIGEKIEDINNNLKNSVLMFGIDEKNFENCLVLEDVEDYILNSRIEAAKNYKIESTPTIIINDEKFEGSLDYKTLKEEIEKLI